MDWHNHSTKLMRTVLKQLLDEQLDQDESAFQQHKEALGPTRSALDELSRSVDGFENLGTWAALDEGQVLRLLSMLTVLRSSMEGMELELLDAARHAGIAWESIEPIYAAQSAPVAKARYADLAMRHAGWGLLGPGVGEK